MLFLHFLQLIETIEIFIQIHDVSVKWKYNHAVYIF